MSAQHTPGPWVVAGPDAASGPGYVMTRGGTYVAKPLINYDANARLIAAAPELLEALEGLLSFAEDVEAKALVGDEGCLWPVEIARFAIAKARGQ